MDSGIEVRSADIADLSVQKAAAPDLIMSNLLGAPRPSLDGRSVTV